LAISGSDARRYGFLKRIEPKYDSADEDVSSESMATEMTPGASAWPP
jgi:hypothetical protein